MEWPQIFTLIKSMFDELEILRDIPYSKLQFRSGNNDIIKLITDNMTEILLEDSLIIKRDGHNSNLENYEIEWNREKAHELREVLLFLMLNTNLSYRRNLTKCNQGVEHLYKIFNLLPPFLFMEIVWTCQLDNLFFEMLSYAPAWLSHPFYEEANRSLSFLSDPFDVVNKIGSIFNAVIVSIAVSHGKGRDSLDRNMLNETMPSYIDKLLLHFDKRTQQIGSFKAAKWKRFKGHWTLNLLKMCNKSIEGYKQRLVMPDECNIYKTFIKKKDTCRNEPRTELIKNLFAKVLNALQNVLKTIDINTFMEWTEVETECGYENLQEHIGALAFMLNEHLNHKTALVKHDIIRELKVFVIKPVPFLRRLKEATIGVLLNMLEDQTLLPNQTKECFNEIFRRPIIYGNDECINNLMLYADKLKLTHCKRIIGFMIVDLNHTNLELMECEGSYDYDEDKYSNLVKLLYDIYKNFTSMEKVEFLIFRHKHFINYNDIKFQLPAFQKRYHSFWNQFGTCFDWTQFLLLCFESEDAMWCQFYAHILMTNNYFNLPWQLSDTYAELRLSMAMKKSLLLYNQIANKFYGNVFAINYWHLSLSTQKDVEDEILKIMLDTVKRQKFRMTYQYIKILSTISDHTLKSALKSFAFNKNILNVLARVAFVMHKSLWRVRTFSCERARLVSECQQFLEANSNDFMNKADSQIAEVAFNRLGCLPYSPQVMYYMRAIFIKKKLMPFVIYMEVCYKEKQNLKGNKRMIATILMRSTGSELINYACLSYVSPRKLSSIIRKMMYIVGKIRTKHAYENFYYAYNTYMCFLTNAINDKDDYNKWYYDDLLDDIMKLITSTKKMQNRLLVDSNDLFVTWTKHDKNIGKQIINKLKQMPSSIKLTDTLNKLKSAMALSLPSSSTKAQKQRI